MRRNTNLALIFLAFLAFSLAGCKTNRTGEGAPVADAEGGGGKVSKEKQKIDYLFVEANTQYIQGKNEEAIALFEQVLEKDPKHHASLFNIGKINLELERYDEAVKSLKQAISLDDDNFWYYDLLRRAYEGKLEYNKALEVLKTIVSRYPEDKDSRYDLAQMYIQTRDYSRALEVYDELEKMVGINEELIIRKHQLNLQLNRPEAAIAEIEKLIVWNPYDSRYYQMKYDILMAMDRQDEARSVMEKILDINPDDGLALLSMADYYRSQGDIEKSDEYLFRAFRNPSVDMDAKIQILGGLFTFGKNDPEVMDRMKRLVNILSEQNSKSAVLYAIKGDLYNMEGKADSALYFFRAALDIDPANEQLWQQVLLVHSEANDYPSMRKDAEAALEYFPNQTIFLYFFGVGSLQMEEYDEAVYAFEKVKKTAGDNPDMLLQANLSLAEVYNDLEEYSKSDENFEEALEIDPNNALVLNNYAYYLSLRNERLADATDMVKKALQLSPTNSAYLDTYGWILYLEGDYEGAEEWIKKSIDHGGIGEVYEHYGDVQIKMGNRALAEEFWRKAQESGIPDLDLEQKLKDHNLK